MPAKYILNGLDITDTLEKSAVSEQIPEIIQTMLKSSVNTRNTQTDNITDLAEVWERAEPNDQDYSNKKISELEKSLDKLTQVNITVIDEKQLRFEFAIEGIKPVTIDINKENKSAFISEINAIESKNFNATEKNNAAVDNSQEPLDDYDPDAPWNASYPTQSESNESKPTETKSSISVFEKFFNAIAELFKSIGYSITNKAEEIKTQTQAVEEQKLDEAYKSEGEYRPK